MSKDVVNKINGVQMRQYLRQTNKYHEELNAEMSAECSTDADAATEQVVSSTNCNCLDDLEKHPAIVRMDKKLSKILFLLETQQKYQSKNLKYFKVKDDEDLNRLEEVLDKDWKERLQIKAKIKQWKGCNSTVQTMNVVMQNIFTDDFLSKYNLTGSRVQKQLIDLQICMLLAEIWTEAGVSQADFYKIFRYCIRLAHNRCYRINSNSKSKSRKLAAKTVISNKAIQRIQHINDTKTLSKYFQISNNDSLMTVENVLQTNDKETQSIRDLVLKWKTENNLSTVKSMNAVLQKLFTDEFLGRYNMKGSKKQNDFLNYKIIKMFQEIFSPLDTTQEQFIGAIQYCLRLAHHRHESATVGQNLVLIVTDEMKTENLMLEDDMAMNNIEEIETSDHDYNPQGDSDNSS